MAVRQYATFEVDGQYFGVDVARVQEVFRHHDRTPVPLAPPTVAGLINLRGEVIPAIDVRTRMGLPRRESGDPMNVVVRDGDEVVSLLVDSIGDVSEADDAAVEPPPTTITGPARDMILGAIPQEGRLLLLLDVSRTVDVNQELGREDALA
ncbi:MAG: purine-binding chemotaxis protein CheW [Actinomycetota bacterium]|jgi:purine-binding chemotaxis protein CheW|nr:Chemotaxis protein cheW [Cryptosporangiaceae bacterium]MDQ1678567.1 purine-binding chemotaxis protein CheW [Actinomycetota bacterium]